MGKRQLRRHAATNMRDLSTWQHRAAALLAANDYAGAMRLCRRALKVAPPGSIERAEVLCNLGVAQMQAQQFEEAYDTYTEAIAIAADDADLYYNRAIAARLTLRVGHSVRDMERAVALSAEEATAADWTAELSRGYDLAQAEIDLREPGFTLDQLVAQEALFHQALTLAEAREWAAAEQVYRAALAISDRHPPAWGNLGICLAMQRRYDEAEAALRAALGQDPSYELARRNLVALPDMRRHDDPQYVEYRRPFEGRTIPISASVRRK